MPEGQGHDRSFGAGLVVHVFCMLCGETTQQVYIRDLGIYEDYLCQQPTHGGEVTSPARGSIDY